MAIALGRPSRRRLATALMVLAWPGCGFPEVAFDPSDASDSGVGLVDATAPPGEAEAMDTGNPSGDTTLDMEGGASVDAPNNAADGPEGGSPADAPSDARDAAVGAEAGARDASDAGPLDANVADAHDAALDGGVNCDCGAGAMIPTHVTCSGILNLGILTCTSAAGFSDNGPLCGQSSNSFVTCPSGIQLACTGIQSTAVQRCLP
jgi:hypothetical protein